MLAFISTSGYSLEHHKYSFRKKTTYFLCRDGISIWSLFNDTCTRWKLGHIFSHQFLGWHLIKTPWFSNEWVYPFLLASFSYFLLWEVNLFLLQFKCQVLLILFLQGNWIWPLFIFLLSQNTLCFSEKKKKSLNGTTRTNIRVEDHF